MVHYDVGDMASFVTWGNPGVHHLTTGDVWQGSSAILEYGGCVSEFPILLAPLIHIDGSTNKGGPLPCVS